MMHRIFPQVAILITVLLFLAGCSSEPPPTLEGAWLGTGQFHSSHGDQEVKAQLEVLSDGSYRFLILEPRILMLAGVEEGDWKRNGDQLSLTPYKEEPGEEGRSVLFSSAPRNFQPKTLTIDEDLEFLLLSDGKMDLEFTPNEVATTKLRESGDVE